MKGEEKKIPFYSDKKRLQNLAKDIKDFKTRDYVESTLYTINKLGKEVQKGRVYKKKRNVEELLNIIATQLQFLYKSLHKNFNIEIGFPEIKPRFLPEILKKTQIRNSAESVKLREGIPIKHED